MFAVKAIITKLAERMGYRIEKRVVADGSALDLFALAVAPLATKGAAFRFLQVGANDGVADDPIRAYIMRWGWSGVMLEPQPGPFAALVGNYRGSTGLEFINAALAESDGTITLYTAVGAELMAGLSTRSLRRRGIANIREIQVPSISAKTLIARYSLADADLLQVDIEGHDAKGVGLLLEAGMRPTIIRFEQCNVPGGELQELLSRLGGLGYKVAQIGIDMLAVLDPEIR